MCFGRLNNKLGTDDDNDDDLFYTLVASNTLEQGLTDHEKMPRCSLASSSRDNIRHLSELMCTLIGNMFMYSYSDLKFANDRRQHDLNICVTTIMPPALLSIKVVKKASRVIRKDGNLSSTPYLSFFHLDVTFKTG